MKVFEYESVAESYADIIKYIWENGNEVSPRGMLTKEVTPATIVINNPRKRVIDHPIRKLNYGFMIGELFWILQGKNDASSIAHYNKQWLNYSDNGETLNGAYGQRIFNADGGDALFSNEEGKYDVFKIQINQFNEVFKKLKNDNHSRQGTISMFDPAKDFNETKDVPCTNLLRFSIRDGKLNMLVVMRSNDIIFGTPYDIYNFTMLQEIMAGLLEVEVGKYTHVVDSLHLYETHFELAKEIINHQYEDVYNNFEPMDARLKGEELDKVTNLTFNIENITRETGDVVEIPFLVEQISSIENEYWRSIVALIATYNVRKAKRSQEEIDELKSLVTNEFKGLISKWNELKK
ncbi:thymidylate synthase [Bacillus phage G]|uniref:thymidylate synthase n=1 Tax=Bacillus phage G TaxID=2884420 RepID=G3MA60_9CAUD|nr:thymidylate synthase [Bacillus phage G]AEO93578.1 gp319 [Bacillus phage G]